jgi:hypothetical protein
MFHAMSKIGFAMSAPPATESTARVLAKMVILAAGLMVGGFLLLGLPGAVWMAPGEVLIPLMFGRRPPGDTAWPIAIMVSLIWPWFIPLFHWLIAQHTKPGWPRGLMVAGLTAVAAVTVALICQWSALR